MPAKRELLYIETKIPLMEHSSDSYNKVAHLIEEYGLGESFGRELEDYWTGRKEERKSLRELADLFNKQLLQSAIRQTGATPNSSEITLYYRTLTDESTSSGERMEIRNNLQRMGADIDTIESDFVSYQAIRSYLKDIRGAEYQSKINEDIDQNALNSVQKLESKLEAVAESNLSRLIKRDTITVGEYRLITNVMIYCEDCSRQFTFNQLFREGGCGCVNQPED